MPVELKRPAFSVAWTGFERPLLVRVHQRSREKPASKVKEMEPNFKVLQPSAFREFVELQADERDGR